MSATRRPDLYDVSVLLVKLNPNSSASQIAKLAERWATAGQLLTTKPWGSVGLVLARLDFTTGIGLRVPQALSDAVRNGHLTFADDSYSITPAGLAHLSHVRL